MNNLINVSIIIINYKTPQLVIDCVNSIVEKTNNLNYEIIVVDNNSEDNSKDIIERYLDGQIIFIESKENLGFGTGNNLGVQYARGEYLFFLNSDTVLINNAIKILYDYMISHKEVGIVGGNLYTIDLKPSPSFSMSFDKIEDYKDNSKWLTILKNKLFRHKQKKNIVFNDTDEPLKVGYVYGTDMMMKKKLFDDIHGFDSDFFMYAEEEDLSYRVVESGKEIWSIPDARIIHLDGGSSISNNKFNSKHFKMRLHGGFIYFKKRLGNEGIEKYYKYRKRLFVRDRLIAKLLHRTNTVKIRDEHIKCIEEVYQNVK